MRVILPVVDRFNPSFYIIAHGRRHALHVLNIRRTTTKAQLTVAVCTARTMSRVFNCLVNNGHTSIHRFSTFFR